MKATDHPTDLDAATVPTSQHRLRTVDPLGLLAMTPAKRRAIAARFRASVRVNPRGVLRPMGK